MDNCDRFMMLCILCDMAKQSDNKGGKSCCKTQQKDTPKTPKSELPCVNKNNNQINRPATMMYKTKR